MVMGSKSTYLRGGVGGFRGRALRKGDVLFRGPTRPAGALPGRVIPPALLKPLPEGVIELRAVLGPQDDYFTSEGIDAFLSGEYTLKSNSDRMGCRLSGSRIVHKGPAEIISDGVAPGSVQVPADGQPIVMMADRQTTGGYPKIATVISPDLDILAQARPGDRVRFRQVTVEAAHRFLREVNASWKSLRHWLRGENVKAYRLEINGEMFDVLLEEIF